eukprot:6990-Heterococcus_DN1.PRE.10
MARHHYRRSTAQDHCAAAQERATELAAQLTGVTTARAELRLQLDTAIAEKRTVQESSAAAQASATTLTAQLAALTAARTDLELQLTQRTTERNILVDRRRCSSTYCLAVRQRHVFVHAKLTHTLLVGVHVSHNKRDVATATITAQSEQLSSATADLLAVQQQLTSATAEKVGVADELATQTVETATLNSEKCELLQQLEALKADKDVAVAATAAKDEQLAVRATAYGRHSRAEATHHITRLLTPAVCYCACLLCNRKDAADGKVAEHAGLMAAIDTEMIALRQQMDCMHSAVLQYRCWLLLVTAMKDSAINTVASQAAELLQVRSDSTALQQQLDATRIELAATVQAQESTAMACPARRDGCTVSTAHSIITAAQAAELQQLRSNGTALQQQLDDTRTELAAAAQAKESTAVTINELRAALAQATTAADQLPAVQLALSALQEEMAALTVQHTALVQPMHCSSHTVQSITLRSATLSARVAQCATVN